MALQLQISSLFCTLIAHTKLSKDLFPTVTTSSYKFSTPVEITYAANMADCRTILKAIFKCTINTKIAQISKVLLQKNEYTIKMRLKHSVNAIYLSDRQNFHWFQNLFTKLSKDLFPTVTTSLYKFSTPVEITYTANMADCRTILKAIFKCTIKTKIAQISEVLLQRVCRSLLMFQFLIYGYKEHLTVIAYIMK